MVRQYIGARYTPKFSGTYDATQAYEALEVVDNGAGTSYISRIPVPPNTPLTNTEYWLVYGSSSGAIIDLQNRVGNIESVDIPRIDNSITTISGSILSIGGEVDKINNESIVGSMVTPEMFGAAGDGVTDDSEAIETASQAGALYCGDKTYYIANSIDIVNPVIGGKFKISPTAKIAVKTSGIHIHGSEFYNSTYPSDRGNWLLDLYYVHDVNVEGCVFHTACNALYIDHGKNINVVDSIFKNLIQNAASTGGNGYGILTIESENIHIENNSFIDVARHSIYLSVESGTSYNKDIFIKNNVFEWTTSVVGNTTGFEITMMIRPTVGVYIEGNTFINMYGICDLYRQTVTVGGVNVVKACENVYIKNNVGSFKFLHRSDGVVYLDGNSTLNQYESHSNINIEDNNFTIEGTSAVKVGNFNMLKIRNNYFKFNTGGDYYPLVYCETSADSLDSIRNLLIDGNRIDGEGASGTPIINFVYGSSSNVKSHGLLGITNNIIRNCRYLFSFAGDNARSFTSVIITNNTVEFIPNSATNNNMHEAAIEYLSAAHNSFTDLCPLRSSAPSHVPMTDAVVVAFGTPSAPSDSVLGSLYRDANTNKLLIKTPSGWSEL